jgi:hypothetical protein
VADDEETQRNPVLAPTERAAEVLFGALMALSITGSVSVGASGHEDLKPLISAALGCNLAWGLTDAVMYLVNTATERHRKSSLLRQLQATGDTPRARELVRAALPDSVAAGASDEIVEALRQRLVVLPAPDTRLQAQDFLGGLGVFGLVVLSTFPTVLPLMLVRDPELARRLSNLLGLATLFGGGCVLGHYAYAQPFRWGLAMAGIGGALVLAIVALGG